MRSLTLALCLSALVPLHAQTGHRRLSDSASARLSRELRGTGRLVLPEIQFEGARDTLTVAADSVIRRISRALSEVPDAFLIEAHTAPTADAAADLSRTDRRAAAVKARLVAYGISPTRLITMGYGATKAPRQSPDGHPVSRNRIEVSRIP
jgi:outer membrane protein OmpA-like peptidoglycan-associated protein